MTDRISIEVKGARAFAEQSKLSPKRIDRVMRMAANRTMRSLAKQFPKDIAAAVGLKRPSLKKRIRFSPSKVKGRSNYARVWVGLNPMNASRYAFGRLREDETGAFANEYYFPEGFIADYGAKDAIWRRFGPNDSQIKVETVAIDQPDTRRRMTASIESAGKDYVNEIALLAKREWRKIAEKTKRKSG